MKKLVSLLVVINILIFLAMGRFDEPPEPPVAEDSGNIRFLTNEKLDAMARAQEEEQDASAMVADDSSMPDSQNGTASIPDAPPTPEEPAEEIPSDIAPPVDENIDRQLITSQQPSLDEVTESAEQADTEEPPATDVEAEAEAKPEPEPGPEVASSDDESPSEVTAEAPGAQHEDIAATPEPASDTASAEAGEEPAATESETEENVAQTADSQVSDSTDETGLAAPGTNDTAEPLAPECFAIGPIEVETDVDPILESLADRDITGQVRKEEEMDVRGFRVLVPTHSLDEAVPVVNKIRDSGDKDVLFLRDGVHKGKVSVGVYARRANAEVRQRQIDKLDIDTEIEPIGDLRTYFWVDLMLRKPGGLPDEVVRQLKEDQPDLEVIPRSCDKPEL